MSDRASKILLAISLAFNVFILGAAAGAGYMWYASDRPKLAPPQRALRFAAEYLSPEQRRDFRQRIVTARRSAMPNIESAHASRDELARLLVQEQFDRTAIVAELTKIRNTDLALRTRLEEAVVGFAETLSPADRQRLVEGLAGRSNMLRRTAPGKN